MSSHNGQRNVAVSVQDTDSDPDMEKRDIDEDWEAMQSVRASQLHTLLQRAQRQQAEHAFVVGALQRWDEAARVRIDMLKAQAHENMMQVEAAMGPDSVAADDSEALSGEGVVMVLVLFSVCRLIIGVGRCCVCLSVCLSGCLSVCPVCPVCLSVCLSGLSVCLSVCLSV